MADPMVNITIATMIDFFLPMRSATGPLTKDPNHAAAPR